MCFLSPRRDFFLAVTLRIRTELFSVPVDNFGCRLAYQEEQFDEMEKKPYVLATLLPPTYEAVFNEWQNSPYVEKDGVKPMYLVYYENNIKMLNAMRNAMMAEYSSNAAEREAESEGLNEESCQDPEEAEGCREVEKLYKSAILKISSSCETVSLVMYFFKNEIVKEGFMAIDGNNFRELWDSWDQLIRNITQFVDVMDEKLFLVLGNRGDYQDKIVHRICPIPEPGNTPLREQGVILWSTFEQIFESWNVLKANVVEIFYRLTLAFMLPGSMDFADSLWQFDCQKIEKLASDVQNSVKTTWQNTTNEILRKVDLARKATEKFSTEQKLSVAGKTICGSFYDVLEQVRSIDDTCRLLKEVPEEEGHSEQLAWALSNLRIPLLQSFETMMKNVSMYISTLEQALDAAGEKNESRPSSKPVGDEPLPGAALDDDGSAVTRGLDIADRSEYVVRPSNEIFEEESAPNPRDEFYSAVGGSGGDHEDVDFEEFVSRGAKNTMKCIMHELKSRLEPISSAMKKREKEALKRIQGDEDEHESTSEEEDSNVGLMHSDITQDDLRGQLAEALAANWIQTPRSQEPECSKNATNSSSLCSSNSKMEPPQNPFAFRQALVKMMASSSLTMKNVEEFGGGGDAEPEDSE